MKNKNYMCHVMAVTRKRAKEGGRRGKGGGGRGEGGKRVKNSPK